MNVFVDKKVILIGLITGLFFPQLAWANVKFKVDEGSTTSQSVDEKKEQYLPEYFKDYFPQTAFDMVQRLPGFVFIEEDNDVRGFASGAGNILIDGTRPTTKSGGIKEALERIPYAQVVRIDILRGSAGSADTAGQSVVANIVRIKNGSAKRWQAGFLSSGEGKISPSVIVTLSQQLGQWESAFTLNAKKEYAERDATITTWSENNDLLTTQYEQRPSTINDVFLSGDASTNFDDQTLKVNARVGWSQYLPDTTRVGYHDSNTENHNTESNNSLFTNERDSQYYTGELGLDWTIPVDKNWQWRLLSLNNIRNWFVDANTNTEQPTGTFASGSVFRFDEDTSENILRATLSQQVSINSRAFFQLLRQEYGVELAYSQMKSSLQLWPVNNLHQQQFISRNTYAKVSEQRAESFINITWQLPNVILETGLAAENSTISVSGDSSQTQSLFFLKPSLALIYDQNESTQYRFNLKRTVGQLDFSDFAASADLVDDRAISGNPTLEPETAIYAGLAFDFRFAEKGAFGIELYHEWRSDVLEKIVLPTGEQALGNAGDAKVEGIKLSANLPLDILLDDALLTLKANFSSSTFDDPVTGFLRELTGQDNPDAQIDFRQDITQHQISWGFGYIFYQENKVYYVNEYINSRTAGRWNAFIETTRFGDFKLRLEAENIGGEQESRERSLHQTNRLGKLLINEKSERVENASIRFTVSNTF